MPKVISDSEKSKIEAYVNQGMNDSQIVSALGWTHKTAVRTVRKIRLSFKDLKSIIEVNTKTLDEMSKEERFEYLKDNIEKFPRVKMIFKAFNIEEKAVFLDEYLRIMRSMDSVTEAEEQTLFTAILEYVLACRSLKLKSLEEDLYERSMNGEFAKGDPEFRNRVDDRFQREYESHMKQYESLLKTSKATRNQRLSEVKSERRSLVDVAEELSNKTAQADAAEKIVQLSKLRDEELKRLVENGHLFGEFGD